MLRNHERQRATYDDGLGALDSDLATDLPRFEEELSPREVMDRLTAAYEAKVDALFRRRGRASY